MKEKQNSLIKRPAKRVPESQQPAFDFCKQKSSSSKVQLSSPTFIEEDPNTIFLGNSSLREYLAAIGLNWVINLRDILRNSDLSAFTDEYSPKGRKAIHPHVILGLIIYGILMKKSSLRELEGLASRDLGAWWICGGLRPDHSTIGKFINLHSETISEEYFVTLTTELVSKLKLKSGTYAADGTTIEAAACRYKVIKAEAAHIANERAKAKAKLNPDSEYLKKKAEQAEKISEIALARQKERKANGRDESKVSVSSTEPEAIFQKLKNKTYRPAYTPSILVNENKMILGHNVQSTSENNAINPMLEQNRKITASEPETVMLDAGYFCFFILGLFVALDIDILCPEGTMDCDNDLKKKNKSAKFGRKEFSYDYGNDSFICPARQTLKRVSIERDRSGNIFRKYMTKHCDGCKLRKNCTNAKKGRAVIRYESQDLKDAMLQVFEAQRAREKYRKRKAIVEPVFAEIKCRQGLSRFRTKGLAKVRAEFSLHCIAYNLKRAISLDGRLLLLLFTTNTQEIKVFIIRIKSKSVFNN